VSSRPRAQLYEAFGAYVRSQRQLARLSLRQAADLARISNPYLSQIEHGLALPSVTVLSALAEALHVSADTLLLHAAGMGADGATERSAATEDAIRHDPRLDDAQKHALLAVLASFVAASPPRSESPSRSEKTHPTTVDGDTPAAAARAPRRRRPPKAPTQDRKAPKNA
jgi:transcriptional regulator with XRE-family HTH domain